MDNDQISNINKQLFEQLRALRKQRALCSDTTLIDSQIASVREQIINNNMGLCKTFADKFRNILDNQSCYDFSDLVSIATISMIEAIDSYDLDMNVAFSTYSGKYIQNSLLKLYKVQKVESRHTPYSLQTPISDDDDDRTLMDTIAGRNNIEEFIENTPQTDFEGLIKFLPKIDKEFVRMVYLEKPLSQFKERYGISDKQDIDKTMSNIYYSSQKRTVFGMCYYSNLEFRYLYFNDQRFRNEVYNTLSKPQKGLFDNWMKGDISLPKYYMQMGLMTKIDSYLFKRQYGQPIQPVPSKAFHDMFVAFFPQGIEKYNSISRFLSQREKDVFNASVLKYEPGQRVVKDIDLGKKNSSYDLLSPRNEMMHKFALLYDEDVDFLPENILL